MLAKRYWTKLFALLTAMGGAASFSAAPATPGSARPGEIAGRRRSMHALSSLAELSATIRARTKLSHVRLSRRQVGRPTWSCAAAPRKPPVEPTDLPACVVYLYDEATSTHVYLVGSIHVSVRLLCGALRCSTMLQSLPR